MVNFDGLVKFIFVELGLGKADVLFKADLTKQNNNNNKYVMTCLSYCVTKIVVSRLVALPPCPGQR